MSIKKGGPGFIVECDTCSDYLEVESYYGNFDDVLEEMRLNEWVSRKENGKWIHFCCMCK